MNSGKYFAMLLSSLFIAVSAVAQTEYKNQWPQFRGPLASGIVESDLLPDRWDITTGENIRWQLRGGVFWV